MARDRPSPYGKVGVLSAARGRLRSGDRKLQTEKATVLDTVARGPVPRDRCMARETRSDARVET